MKRIVEKAGHVTFEDLRQLPLVRQYEEVFQRATGISLHLAPAGLLERRLSFGARENAFCALVGAHPKMAQVCLRTEAEGQRLVSETLTPQTIRCLAGLRLLAAPVLVHGKHVARWFGGQVFHRKPTRRDFQRVADRLRRLGVKEGLEQLETPFLGGAVVPEKAFQASASLLGILAEHLGVVAPGLMLSAQSGEPPSVTRARAWIEPMQLSRSICRRWLRPCMSVPANSVGCFARPPA